MVCLIFAMKFCLINLSRRQELVTEIVFVMGGYSSIFPLMNFMLSALINAKTSVIGNVFTAYFYVEKRELCLFC